MTPAKSKRKLAVVATALAVHVERWQWRQLIASDYGPTSATTRHVLHVLALHMKPTGAGAWPSQSTIARRTGLTTRAVKLHIAIAKRTFWLNVAQHHYTGQGWRRNTYEATAPAELLPVIQALEKGGEPDSPTLERGEPDSPRWGTSFPKVVNHVPPNLFLNTEVNLFRGRQPPRSVDNSSTQRPRLRSKDDLKNRSAEKSGALRARIAAAPRTLPTRSSSPSTLTDAELAAKARKLRAVGQGDGDIRRTLASQASAAQLTRVLKSL